MRIVVLGSAAGGGFPQWNCRCANCRRARAGDPRALPRTQSSLAVSADGVRWALLNASPDIRQQLERTPALHPFGPKLRDSPIAAVVLTNADVDHVAGLLSLRERQPLTLYATGKVLSVLASNPIFDVLDGETVRRERLLLDARTMLRTTAGDDIGLAVTAFPAPGKVPLWLEHSAAGELRGGDEDTVGLRLEDVAGGGSFFFVPACAALNDDLARRSQAAPLVFFDGTTWTDDEMPASGVGAKTALRMGHLSMAGPSGSLSAFAPLDVRRRVYIHINNTNPVLLADSPERRHAERCGWEIARDGQEIDI